MPSFFSKKLDAVGIAIAIAIAIARHLAASRSFTYQKRGIAVKKKEISIKKLLFGALISLAVLISSAVCAFMFLFVSTQRVRDVIIIPSLVGRKYSEIQDYDRITFECEHVYSSDVPEGEIISQEPYSGARRKVAEGELYTVKLMVSLGEEDKTLPNLKNYTYADAARVLRELGAQIRIVSVYDDEAESDRVLHTSPKAGERIERGERVTLFVCRKHIKGSVKVRDFVGYDQGAACAQMIADGLLVGEIRFESSDTAESGVVISQSIAAGSYVRYHTKIDITVSLGKEDKFDKLHPFGRIAGGDDEKRRN